MNLEILSSFYPQVEWLKKCRDYKNCNGCWAQRYSITQMKIINGENFICGSVNSFMKNHIAVISIIESYD